MIMFLCMCMIMIMTAENPYTGEWNGSQVLGGDALKMSKMKR